MIPKDHQCDMCGEKVSFEPGESFYLVPKGRWDKTALVCRKCAEAEVRAGRAQ